MISRTPVFLVFAAALAVFGCDPGGPRVTPRVAPVAAGPVAATHVTPNTPGPRRGQLIAGERVARVPSWPPASTIAAGVRERLPQPLREAVDRCPVPVLVPGDASWLARATMHSPADANSYGYALAAGQGDLQVSVQASRIATLLPHVGHHRGNRRIRGGEGWYSDNDGIRTASWIEHGVAYTLDLECRAARDCTDAAIEGLVEGLVYVGGAGAAGGAR